MSFPRQIIDALAKVFARASKQLHSTEYVGDHLAKQILDLPYQGAFWLVGHAISTTGKKNQIVTDEDGTHYLVDDNKQIHLLG